jgi:hypothetical protein
VAPVTEKSFPVRKEAAKNLVEKVADDGGNGTITESAVPLEDTPTDRVSLFVDW